MAELFTKLPNMTPVKAILIGSDGTNAKIAKVDSQGNLIVTGDLNPLDKYQPADADMASDTKYFGYVDVDGNWYIMREVTTTGQYRFVKGTSGYDTAWTAKTSQSYDYFNNVF